jgi:hypothetical protein
MDITVTNQMSCPAATYVIDQQRKNCVHVLDAEYRNRAEADDILAALDAIQK